MSDVLEEFLEDKRLLYLSDKTIEDYGDLIKPFIKFCGDVNAGEVTDTMVNAYIVHLLERDLSKSTRITYIRNMKIFLRWMSSRYSVVYDYTRVRVPKAPKKNVRIYGDVEIEKMFLKVRTESEWMTWRNRSIIALMLDSGLRQNEVCMIKRDEVSFDSRYIVVHGKGDKERVVPFGLLSMEYVQRYLEECPFGSRYLFVNRRGAPLSRNALRCMVYKISEQLDFDLSSHRLRHNFATNYCIDHYQKYGSMDAYKLMSLMGHEDMETTKRYLHHAKEIIASQEHLSHLDMLKEKR